MSGGDDRNVTPYIEYNIENNNNNNNNNNSQSFYEKNRNLYCETEEEFRSCLNEPKLADECPWKFEDQESRSMQIVDCWIHFQEKGKRIRKDRAGYIMKKWLFPEWESDEDRDILRRNWEKSKAKRAGFQKKDDNEASERSASVYRNALLSLNDDDRKKILEEAEREIASGRPDLK